MRDDYYGIPTIILGVAGGTFLIALLFFLVLTPLGFIASFFLSILIALFVAILVYLGGVGMDAGEEPRAEAAGPAAAVAPTAPAAATGAASSRPSVPDPAPSPAPPPGPTATANAAGTESATAPVPSLDAGASGDPVMPVKPDEGGGARDGGDEGTRPMALDRPEGEPDDLKKIKGVGPKLEGTLHSLGIYHFRQIASWGPEEVAWVDENLEGFKGRVSRDDWVSQAKALSEGGSTEFSKRVDEGDVY